MVFALEMIASSRFSGLIAGLGVAGLTLGFALQDVAKNCVAGYILHVLLHQPFGIGHTISVGDYIGTVLEISLRTTEMQTLDG
ncbi:MAG: hypothetical protein A2Z14_14555 [Chloroflexi bacterium RBG_16_48_8]|nr:MAG: hypothetical protein A2Z14_14555 [Chloroflexi bacterium RBG_16_48_8]